MTPPSRSSQPWRTIVAEWSRAHKLAVGLIATAVTLITGAAILGLSLDGSDPDTFGLEAVKAALTLAIGLLLGGVLKIATDDLAEAKRGREQAAEEQEAKRVEAAKRFDALIADLHNNHDRLETARLLISAHRSAKTYGERMRDVIDAHVVLLKLARVPGMGVLAPDRTDAEDLEWMLAYLVALQDEYRSHYKAVSNLQKYDEEVTKQRFTAEANRQVLEGNDTVHEAPPPSELAWNFLKQANFPVLDDLCRGDDQTEYAEHFLGSCRALTRRLEQAKADGVLLAAASTDDGSWLKEGELRKKVQAKADHITRSLQPVDEPTPV